MTRFSGSSLQAGNGGTNTLIAGPQNDLLVGGNGLLNVDHFIAGQGAGGADQLT